MPDGSLSAAQVSDRRRVRVWDLPTRLFHWVLVGLVAALVATGWTGGAALDQHMKLGLAALALLLFRLIWGFAGSATARFTDFVRGPAAVRDYLAGRLRPLGHNPLGGWMVLALLAVLLTQAVTGLFANDDILTEGPLAHLVSSATSGSLTKLHKLLANVLLGLVGLHVAAVLVYLLVKRENLIRPMVTGMKQVSGREAEPRMVSAGRAAVVLAVAVAVVWGLTRL